MELSNLSPAALTNIIRLVEEKQTLLARLEKTDAAMRALIGGAPAAPHPRPAAKARPSKTPKPAKAAKTPVAPSTEAAEKPAAPARALRGALKEGILAALEKAGPDGVAASALASQLGVAPGNVHVWFATTGKKLSAITKVAPGRYALAAAAPAALAVAEVPEPAPLAPEPAPLAPEPAPFTPIAREEAPLEEPAPLPIDEETETSTEPEIVEELTTIVPVAEDAPEPKDDEFQLLASE